MHTEPELAGRHGRHLHRRRGPPTPRWGPDHLIDKRDTLRADPPDILLTNYKMLDFLLLRREDRNLWAANEPETLRYVVLDEFHTYDGAQGTDVAMLLRRLGRTLGMKRTGPATRAAPPRSRPRRRSALASVQLDELRELRRQGVRRRVRARSPSSARPARPSRKHAAAVDYLLPIPDVDELLEVGDDSTHRCSVLTWTIACLTRRRRRRHRRLPWGSATGCSATH